VIKTEQQIKAFSAAPEEWQSTMIDGLYQEFPDDEDEWQGNTCMLGQFAGAG
jgi:nitroimidazol reductase NimA-like FMN-containing flavoprotein (pyridoxamine 5'-phosphate oxidase superfamily)